MQQAYHQQPHSYKNTDPDQVQQIQDGRNSLSGVHHHHYDK